VQQLFDNPRGHTGAGYHRVASHLEESGDRKKRRLWQNGSSVTTSSRNASLFEIGDRAHVSGFADCTIRSEVQTSGSYVGRILIEYDDGLMFHVKPNELVEIPRDEEAEAQAQLERLRKEAEALELEKEAVYVEKAHVQAIVDGFAEERRRKADAKTAEDLRKAQAAIAEVARLVLEETERKIQEQRVARGTEINYILHQGEHVFKCFDRTVTCIACGGVGTIMLYERGGWSCTGGVAKLLHNKLNGRQKSLPHAEYVAMGSQDRYYLSFEDGKSEWVGCDEMSKVLNKETSRKVKTVAFGDDWDSFFVVFADGWWCSLNIPHELQKLMDSRKQRADLDCVSLGPSGEYFLQAKNGRAWWGGGMAPKNRSIAGKHKNRITFMDFGDNDTFLYRYT
jgi:hypothetical protein